MAVGEMGDTVNRMSPPLERGTGKSLTNTAGAPPAVFAAPHDRARRGPSAALCTPKARDADCSADVPEGNDAGGDGPGVLLPGPPLPASAGVERDSLYAEFRPLVRRLIRRYGDDAESRNDLEGEIYCAFCELLEAYDPGRGVPLKPYLVRQLTASIYTQARRRWRQARREVTSEICEGTAPSHDPSGQWDEDMVMRQVGGRLPEAIAALPQRQRQVVVWRYYEHRSFEEIAEALGGVQVATARSLLRHGLNNLRAGFARAGVRMDEPAA